MLFAGERGRYGSGGYIAQLGPNSYIAGLMLDQLKIYNWIGVLNCFFLVFVLSNVSTTHSSENPDELGADWPDFHLEFSAIYLWSRRFYRPQTKLRERNVLHVSVG